MAVICDLAPAQRCHLRQ